MGNARLIRDIAFSYALRAALRLYCVRPIEKKRVLFVSFRGTRYACNPRYISEELHRLAGDGIEIGWAFHEPEKFRYLEKEGIRVLGDRTTEFLRFALTARVVCVNGYYKPFMPRRRGQFYLRTWHGGGAYKRVGKYEKLPMLRKMYIGIQQQGADLYLSSSRAFTEMTLRDAFGYRGEVLEKGMPRNDMLINDHFQIAERVRAELNIPENTHIALYAPTFRYDEKKEAYAFDFDRVKRALSERFGGEWVIAYRGHYLAVKEGEKAQFGDVDVTQYPDMQPLLAAADALFTDYSSSMWDMSLTHRPVFLYCPDLKEYISARDFFTDIHTWPFPLSDNGDELDARIREFDENDYRKRVNKHHKELGSYETGCAARAAAERIMKECGLEIKK